MTELINLLLNGAAFGMLIFVLSAGLTMIFGLAGYLNLAHGSMYMVAAFVAVTLARQGLPFAVSILAVTLLMVVVGVASYYLLVHRREWILANPLAQVLVSFGVMYIVADFVLATWGGLAATAPTPEFLEGRMEIMGASISFYRLFVVASGAVIGFALILLERRTMFGAAMRAAVDDRGMLDALGISPRPLFIAVFALGFGLAGLAGGIGAPFLGSYLGVDILVLVYALPVVVLGGLGSVSGAFKMSLVVGIVDSLTKAYIPSLGLFIVYLIVVAVLSWRPQGVTAR